MTDDTQKSKPDKAPAKEKSEPLKPRKPRIPDRYTPGVGIGGIANVQIPKIRPDFEPKTGGPGVMPERVEKSE